MKVYSNDTTERDYCTSKEIEYFIGKQYMSSWWDIQARIDDLNSRNNESGQLRYVLRKNGLGQPFDIQVLYGPLSNLQRQYLKYRSDREQPGLRLVK